MMFESRRLRFKSMIEMSVAQVLNWFSVGDNVHCSEYQLPKFLQLLNILIKFECRFSFYVYARLGMCWKVKEIEDEENKKEKPTTYTKLLQAIIVDNSTVNSL